MNSISDYKNNLQLFYNANDVAKEYGLYSKMITVPTYTGKPDMFLVFSVSPIEDDINPVEIINRNNRNTNLFYPANFAVNIEKENPLLAWDNISKYLCYAEFMCELYGEFQVPLPKKIRTDELSALVTFYCGQNNSNYDTTTRKKYAEGIREFFKQENNKNKFFKEWQEFYRSELFDADKSFVKNFFTFLKRDNPETDINVLLESSYDLKKVYVSEHYYQEFRDVIKSQYPDVKYNVSEKKIVDKGVIVDPDTNESVVTQFGKCVTEEECDRICEERFAKEGFKCVDGLNPSYFEGRDVIYKASDENIIASVMNNICFRWAKCPSFETLSLEGKLKQIDIPASQMKNFYVTMQQYDIPIYIDNDVNRNPNFDVLHVLYRAEDDEKMMKLVAGLTLANISLSHVSSENIAYYIDINKVDGIINQAKLRSQNNSELQSNNSDRTRETFAHEM